MDEMNLDMELDLSKVGELNAPTQESAEIVAEPSQERYVASTNPISNRAKNERRRKKSKLQIFKETTLPLIIIGIAIVLIIVFIIGSITRGVQKRNVLKESSIAASSSLAAEEARQAAEADAILKEAEVLAASYDYDKAIALIDTFSGNIGNFPQLQDARARFEYGRTTLVVWEDPNTILNLSFQHLIADTERAFASKEYSSSLKKNFVTISEFQKILERLYANDYILVNLDDFIEVTTEGDATFYAYKELYLPEDKKPLVLTQTNVNYNLYLVDSDKDLVADKDGLGIASRMVLDDNGNITCEIVNSDGTTSVGAYDLVPILDAFVAEHPDFSYKGAKAVLALTGYNGLFGYRTNASARAKLGEEQYASDVAAVQAIANRLTETGYELGCYTYGNSDFGKLSLANIQKEMTQWNDEVVPILGNLDIMVFAQNSDIKDGIVYSGEKFDYLQSLGFRFYLSFANENQIFTFISEDYVRQARLLVNGNNLKSNAKWFSDIFDTENLLDESR